MESMIVSDWLLELTDRKKALDILIYWYPMFNEVWTTPLMYLCTFLMVLKAKNMSQLRPKKEEASNSDNWQGS